MKSLPLEAFDRQENGAYRRTCRACLAITAQETKDRERAIQEHGHFWDFPAWEEKSFSKVALAEERKGHTAYIHWLKAVIQERSHPKKQSVASIRYAIKASEEPGVKLRFASGHGVLFVRA